MIENAPKTVTLGPAAFDVVRAVQVNVLILSAFLVRYALEWLDIGAEKSGQLNLAMFTPMIRHSLRRILMPLSSGLKTQGAASFIRKAEQEFAYVRT